MNSVRDVPVLFLMFNRPDLARQVFARIREDQPKRLFIAADGPRHDHPGDMQACRDSRRLAEQVDWHCEVQTLFRISNLGCREAVSSAIAWFFQHVEAGIILEDDCLPDPSFFPYCAALLERYRDNERIMSISGNCFHPRRMKQGVSYSFSRYQFIWGWATWRRAWLHYEPVLDNMPCLFDSAWLYRMFGRSDVVLKWSRIIDHYQKGLVDTWDYPWNFSCWANEGFGIFPAVNLVTNLGFGEGATHTRNAKSPQAGLPISPMLFPLNHPREIRRDVRMDRIYERRFFLQNQLETKLLRLAFVRACWRQLLASGIFRWQRSPGPCSHKPPDAVG